MSAAIALGWFPEEAPAALRQPVAVVRVIDGDTVVVRMDGRRKRVRLLGVDTPEIGRDGRPSEPFARAAERATRSLLAAAGRVELEVEGDRIDDYGRVLGFLWLDMPGGTGTLNLSRELVQRGLGRVVRHFAYPGKAELLALEGEARRSRRGLWAGGGAR